MDDTGGATPVEIASMNGWTLDMARDKVDVTAFGDGFKQYVQGLTDIKGTFKGWWDAAASRVLFDAALGEVAVTLKLVPSELDSTYFFSGPAYIDASIEVAADGAVSISGNFAGAGDWTIAPPPVGTTTTAPGTTTATTPPTPAP